MTYTKIIPIKNNLNRAINYITNADKTNEKVLVGSLNCWAEKAYQQMQNTKSHYDKKDGRLGYHLIQSFQGHPTWRSLIKTDVDESMNWAIKMSEFYVDLKMKGYKVDTSGKYVTVICDGMKRPVRLKSLGKEYLRDEIERKVEDNTFGIHKETYNPKRANFQYIKPPSKYAGWLVWFWWYKQYHQAMRERARPVHKIAREDLIKSMKFLRTYEMVYKYQIIDKSSLSKAISNINYEIRYLIELRADLKKENPIKNEGKINIINIRLRKLRLELHLTEDLPFYAKAIEKKVCIIQPKHKKKSRKRERTR